MQIVIAKSLPLLGLIALGFALKQIGLIQRDDRLALARLMFGVTLPAVVFVSLSRAKVAPGTLLLIAFCALVIPLTVHVCAFWLAQRMRLSRETTAVMVLSTLVSSVMIYLAPFFETFYGTDGLGRVAAYDLGNALIASSYAYYFAISYVKGWDGDWKTAVKRIGAVPHFWAAVLAFVVNMARLPVPSLVTSILEPVAASSVALGMLVLGSFIELKRPAWKPLLATLALRVGLGWVLGQTLIAIMGLQNLDRTVVSLAAATPIGILPLIYAAMYGLDVQFAAEALSFSIVAGAVLTPLLLWIYGLV